ncbi:MAG: protocatechuate 4,5-dioxygenase subunit alpha [Pseudomonadales bacterium]|nr:protocatechuate 4,5-dioxygenase subunit alpha [Pseudomonadales bacterium]
MSNKPYDDIPGTTIFDGDMARKGYWVNQFCMSLVTAENRSRFLADEAAYLKEWQMTDEQRAAVLARDYNTLLALGGNVYFFSKLFFTDEKSFEECAAQMAGMPQADYRAMMINGGRSVVGNRSKTQEGS